MCGGIYGIQTMGDKMKKKQYFLDGNEESVIIQALQTTKELYGCIRDGSSNTHTQIEMGNRIKIINHFLTRTIVEDEEINNKLEAE